MNAPLGLSFDHYGNLLVTSTRAVRLVTLGTAGIVDKTGHVYTLYGNAASQNEWPMNSTGCLTGIIEREPGVINFTDRCQGYLLEVKSVPAGQ